MPRWPKRKPSSPPPSRDLIQRTATAYFNVLNARDTLKADRAAADANSKQLEQAKEKYEVGMSAITDVENAQAAYDQSAANLIAAQQQVITTEEQLRAIIGQPVGELMEPSADMPLRTPGSRQRPAMGGPGAEAEPEPAGGPVCGGCGRRQHRHQARRPLPDARTSSLSTPRTTTTRSHSSPDAWTVPASRRHQLAITAMHATLRAALFRAAASGPR